MEVKMILDAQKKKQCRKCGSNDFGIWTSATTGKEHLYCRSCRRERAVDYNNRKTKNGGKHTEKEWLQKLRQYKTCPRCHRKWDEIPARPDSRYKEVWTKDHIVPLNAGGTDDIGNIQPLCYQCNSGKCDRYWIAKINGNKLPSQNRPSRRFFILS